MRKGSPSFLRNFLFLLISFLFSFLIVERTTFLELFFTDAKFYVSSIIDQTEERSENIVLILMDTYSERSLKVPAGSKWRQFHPQLIDILKRSGASLIVFDMEFFGEEEQWDAQLVEGFTEAGNVIAGESYQYENIPIVRESLLDIGSLLLKAYRNIPRWVNIVPGEKEIPALSVVVSRTYLDRKEELDTSTFLPAVLMEEEGDSAGFWINFKKKIDYFPVFSYVDVYSSGHDRINDHNKTPLSIFKNKIVLIGLNIAMTDRYAFPHTLGSKYPGVYGQAYAIETILQEKPLNDVPIWFDSGFLFIVLLLIILILYTRNVGLRILLIVMVLIAAFSAELVVFTRINLLLNYSSVVICSFLFLAVYWIYRRVVLMTRLKMAVGFDPHYIDTFRQERRKTGGHVQKDVCVLTADIRDYTKFVSENDAIIVAEIMRDFFAAMERIITTHGGYINKYVGDEIIAIYGFPLNPKLKEVRSVRAALSMLKELDVLKGFWQDRELPLIKGIGIGIDTGPLTFTEVGGKAKSQFDVIGDCVNGAARLQEYTKFFEKSLLLTEEVVQELHNEEILRDMFQLLDTVNIRGQGERRIYCTR